MEFTSWQEFAFNAIVAFGIIAQLVYTIAAPDIGRKIEIRTWLAIIPVTVHIVAALGGIALLVYAAACYVFNG